MAVEWIKLNLNVFDGDLMFYSHEHQLIWIKLLLQAGKNYQDGVFVKSNGKPVEERAMLKLLDVKEKAYKEAIEHFVEDEMIEIKDGILKIKNWNKYQNIDKAERKRANDREYQRKRYESKKQEEIKIDPDMVDLLDKVNVVNK